MENRQPRLSAMPVLNRVLRYMLRAYWPLFLLVILCILISAVATVTAATFPQTLVDDYITPMLNGATQDFSGLWSQIVRIIGVMAVGVVAAFAYNRIMVTVSQGTMRRLRNDLFQKMESLPIKYFDTHAHGDI
ncbi:MAG TPA: ABC transporter ATP-binding protein, partial [Candidatus Intestinimonas stercorigallinarum]|nr:ABC transporter ATP-binding protein [Candidatus Intestinimonas stercorigallinarum]